MTLILRDIALSPFLSIIKKNIKIVFQLTSSYILVHKAMIKQLTNLLNAAPNAKLEVVCHNNGINFLNTETTLQASKIKELSEKGVDFAACNINNLIYKICQLFYKSNIVKCRYTTKKGQKCDSCFGLF